MSIDFDPYGPLRRKLASDGVDIGAKFAKRRPASTPAGTGSRAVTRSRIVSICLVGYVLLGLGPIASVAPLTTTAFGDELRDTGAAGLGRVETDKATAPKLIPDEQRGEETGIVPSQADTRDQENGAGNPPVAGPSVTCAEALASEPLQNMDEYLKDIGIRYKAIFDQALAGANCTGQQVADFLVSNGADLYSYREYNGGKNPRNNYYLRYRPGLFIMKIFVIFPIHIVIVEGGDKLFLRSNWGVAGI
ncbi:hypothetical protein [Aurantimonas sp. A3-2-R12]|uniref:hypothetical protein n=1 Tax=Aurantimonas sp. A3-2-R12 TaxID=3114362 RepID=UPI002E182C94|nr:hypothetical protein [Aurantimonas sp. A3-2-R12]